MRALILTLLTLPALAGCGPAILAGVGSSIAVDQCVEKQNEVCEDFNDAIQGED